MVALLLGPPTLAGAQEPTGVSLASTLAVGTRVRVLSTTVQTRVPGVVVAVDETVLTLAPEGGLPLKIPVGSITGLDVSLGRKRNWLKGLGIGVLSGVALGLAPSVDPMDCGPESLNFCSRGEAITGFTLLFGGLGTGIGALIKSDRWAPLTVGLRPSGVANRRPSVEVAATVQF
jgi:hypothetical protein